MTRQRYSSKESWNRIVRLFEGKPVPTDVPGTVSGELLSEDAAISDLAELFAGSLPNETLIFPGTMKFGNNSDYVQISSSGTFQLVGGATQFEDLRVDGLNVRVGAVAPTDETGFRGNSNFYSRNFVHNQADEVQFDVQLPHSWKEGGLVYPHVHFSPWITGTANVQSVRFVLEYYWANVSTVFQVTGSVYSMVYTWTGSNQWSHLIASNPVAMPSTGKTLSSILKCRLYRDNTVTNNLGGKIAFLYFDAHYEVDSFGSNEEYTK